MSKMNTLCGAALIAQIGCVPPAAQPLSSDQAEKLHALLTETDDHLDLLADIADRGTKLFTYNEEEPTGEVLRGEWQTSVDRGFEMLEDDDFLVIPADLKTYNGKAFPHLDDEHEPIILVASLFDDTYTSDVDLIATTMHELSHATNPHLFVGHNVFLNRRQGIDPTIAQINQYKDFAYRDEAMFRIQREVLNFDLGPMDDVSMWIDEDQSINYTTYKLHYEKYQNFLRLVQDNPEEWALEYSGYLYNGVSTPYVAEWNTIEWMSYSSSGITSSIGKTLQNFDVDEADCAEMLTLDSAQYIRDQAIVYATDNMRELQNRYPEYAQEYQREHLQIGSEMQRRWR